MDKYLKQFWFEVKDLTKEIFDKDPMRIRPYLSYANESKIHIKGRILEDEGIVSVEESTIFDNLMNNLKSFKSDEAKHAKVIITYKDQTLTTYTDDDGYFEVDFDIELSATKGDFLEWDTANVMAPEYKNEQGEVIENTVGILLPHTQTEHIIVSDIDDTVLVTHVNSFLKLKLLYNTLFKNEQTRLPFEDVADALHKLTRNADDKQVNPIFYLSNSPWNLYDLLHNFFKFHNIPMGPLFLRDFGLKFGQEYRDFKNHKTNTLLHLLEFYKDKPFILLGDATEGDTDIYLDIYNQFPDRIDHIYIRGDREKTNNIVLDKIKSNPRAPIHFIEHSTDIHKYQDKKHTH